jgi:hypothetical protein
VESESESANFGDFGIQESESGHCENKELESGRQKIEESESGRHKIEESESVLQQFLQTLNTGTC